MTSIILSHRDIRAFARFAATSCLLLAPAIGRAQVPGELASVIAGLDEPLPLTDAPDEALAPMWQSLGGVITDPVVARNQDGRLEVFARGTDNALWHIWQVAPNSTWSGWASLGGVMASKVVVDNNKDGRLEVFVRGDDNALWHIWQTAPNNGWSGWSSLGGIIDGNPVGSNMDGRLEVFTRGTDGALWHIWQKAPNSGW